MKTLWYIIIALNSCIISASDGGYKIGDKASDFSLKNVDGNMVSMSDFPDADGFVIIFTCNHCPFAKAYQDRIIQLDKKYKGKGYPVIAINPNDPEIVPEDSYENMKERAREKGYTFPYLFDESQKVYRMYGATHTPHVFLLKKENNELIVKYIGAIDDNYQDVNAVSQKFLENAIEALLSGTDPDPAFTKAIGCTIKDKSTN
jgi:peroxiredoxin